jgi:hypothetical protein
MTTMNFETNTLHNFSESEKYLDCILKEHEYIAIDTKFLSKNVTETQYICIDCADVRYIYNYLEYEI